MLGRSSAHASLPPGFLRTAVTRDQMTAFLVVAIMGVPARVWGLCTPSHRRCRPVCCVYRNPLTPENVCRVDFTGRRGRGSFHLSKAGDVEVKGGRLCEGSHRGSCPAGAPGTGQRLAPAPPLLSWPLASALRE